MKKLLVVALATASLVGCFSQAQKDEWARRQAAYAQERAQVQSDLESARENATVACANKQTCEKAFSLAKIYVQENADMKIQLSDDTMVSTYNPTEYEYVGLGATKIPGAGESATIKLVVSCKGTYTGSDSMEMECARRMTKIYRGFRPFIEPKLP